jgi:uncharacterized protein
MAHYQREVYVPASPEEVFAWHARDGAFERLVPPWERVAIVERNGGLKEGARATLAVQIGPVQRRWVAEHREVEAPRGFVDRQIEGPFAAWEHRHRFEREGEGTRLSDDIAFELPLGLLGALGRGTALRKLERMFRYRHEVTVADLAAHRRLRALHPEPLTVAISGASGLIGAALGAFLTTGGHAVRRLVRRAPRAGDEIAFSPERGEVGDLTGVDAVIHLAGENVGEGRWSEEKRRRIVESRVEGTRALAEAVARTREGPHVLVSASATGYYGSCGDAWLREDAAPGDDFLATVCQRWEAAADPARAAGVRVVHPRIGIALSPAGGALGELLPPFSLGLGGKQGDGRQWMSWIALDDAIGALAHCAAHPELAGPVNLVAPEPVDNRTFAETLGRVLRRPTAMPLPRAAARAMLGADRAEALLFSSARVSAEKLEASGYVFRHLELETALRHLLGRPL